MLRCEYVGGCSYTSAVLGLMGPGSVFVRPKAFVDLHVPQNFFLVKEQSGWRIDWPALGDKIYLLPSLYAYKGQIGVSKEDAYIYSIVQEKIRDPVGEDACCIEPAVFFAEKEDFKVDLTEVIASVIESSLDFKLPILQTSSVEKERILTSAPDRYIVVCERAVGFGRNWEGLKKIVASVTNLPIIEVVERNKELFSLIEGADFVVSVNTSVVPIAGGFQVPLIAVSNKENWGNGVLQHRVSQFLETEVLECVQAEEVRKKVTGLLNRSRLKCWCGEVKGERRVIENLRIIVCERCGTFRQDVKLSDVGLDTFYQNLYGKWRQVLEKAKFYEDRFAHDVLVSRLRLQEWGHVRGRDWLDVGSGNGALIYILKEEGWNVVGLEKRKVGYPTITWAKAEKYDVISYIDVLEHCFPEAEILKAKEHLRPGGVLIVELPNAFEEPKHFRRLQHLFFFTDGTFRKFVDKCDMRVLKFLKPLKGKMTYILKER